MMPLGPKTDWKEIAYQACAFLVQSLVLAFAAYVAALWAVEFVDVIRDMRGV